MPLLKARTEVRILPGTPLDLWNFGILQIIFKKSHSNYLCILNSTLWVRFPPYTRMCLHLADGYKKRFLKAFGQSSLSSVGRAWDFYVSEDACKVILGPRVRAPQGVLFNHSLVHSELCFQDSAQQLQLFLTYSLNRRVRIPRWRTPVSGWPYKKQSTCKQQHNISPKSPMV